MQHVLVLNQNYQAITLCSPERALVLVILSKAEMVAEVPERKFRSVRKEFSFPAIIRLRNFVHLPYKKVSLTRQNLFKRDGHACVYCGTQDNLTMDHVIPRAQGGRTLWSNLVTACLKCNLQKGNMRPVEAGFELPYKPYRPNFLMFVSRFSGEMHESWKPFLLM